MSIHAKDSTLTFCWSIKPTGSPPVKADFDITLVLPNGTSTYDDDGITTYVAPTATTAGIVTYDLTIAVVGRYQVTLSIGTNAVHIVTAHREVFSVIPPDVVLNGPADCTTQGPTVIPPIDETLYTVTQGLDVGANSYWGFTTRMGPYGPFGSVDRDGLSGEIITTLTYFDSATAGTGFLFGISGDQTSSGADFLFTSITPQGTALVLTPDNRSNFVYDAGPDETEWLWHTSNTPALLVPAVWDGSGPANVVIIPV